MHNYDFQKESFTEETAKSEMLKNFGIPDRPVSVIEEKELEGSRKQVAGRSIFDYCPYCVSRVRRARGSWKEELQPLQSVTYKQLYKIGVANAGFFPDRKPGTELGAVSYEKVFECTVCKDLRTGKPRRISENDFSLFYGDGAKKEQTKSGVLDLNDEKALRAFGF